MSWLPCSVVREQEKKKKPLSGYNNQETRPEMRQKIAILCGGKTVVFKRYACKPRILVRFDTTHSRREDDAMHALCANLKGDFSLEEPSHKLRLHLWRKNRTSRAEERACMVMPFFGPPVDS